MSDFTIPVLDLDHYLYGRNDQKAAFIQAIGDSLVHVGFFALTHHGIHVDLVKKAYRMMEELFLQEDVVKQGYEIPGLKGQRGYTSFGKEHAKDSMAPDLKEFWHVGQELSSDHPLAKVYPANVWPEGLPEFKSVMVDIFRQLEACAFTLLEACALYLSEPNELFRDMVRDGNSILRLIHYPPIPKGTNPSSVRAAAHEDINLITLLIEATESGLEILNRQGEWLPVVTPPGCIIVDSGDMLQNLTNGFFKSTTHRVVNPTNPGIRRFSMPFFVHARSEVDLNPLRSCIAKTGGQTDFPNLTAGEYLHQRLIEIGLS